MVHSEDLLLSLRYKADCDCAYVSPQMHCCAGRVELDTLTLTLQSSIVQCTQGRLATACILHCIHDNQYMLERSHLKC